MIPTGKTEANFKALFADESTKTQALQPYPFCLAYPLEIKEGESLSMILGASDEWQIEPKWDGIRAQVIVREGACVIWSRGEQLLNEQVPEIEDALKAPSNVTSGALFSDRARIDLANLSASAFVFRPGIS